MLCRGGKREGMTSQRGAGTRLLELLYHEAVAAAKFPACASALSCSRFRTRWGVSPAMHMQSPHTACVHHLIFLQGGLPVQLGVVLHGKEAHQRGPSHIQLQPILTDTPAEWARRTPLGRGIRSCSVTKGSCNATGQLRPVLVRGRPGGDEYSHKGGSAPWPKP